MRGVLLALLLFFGTAAGPVSAQQITVKMGVLAVDYPPVRPISRLNEPPDDHGIAGAELAINDNNTTGRFLKQSYEFAVEKVIPDQATAALDKLIAGGASYIVTFARADDLLALADHAKGSDVVLLNALAEDNRLRNDDCRANVVHIAPSRAMMADGLAQYMIWKKWREWFLIHGSHDEDRLKAEAYRRAAKKFGAKIVEERIYEDTGGGRMADSGHVQVQKQMPLFTSRADDHDVVVAADESEIFAGYLAYRTTDPRPIVGDAGLIARMWHPAHEGWGATQLQRRFEKLAKRRMRDLDYQAWLALRMIGEAVTRAKTKDFAAVVGYLLSPDFEIAGFKGQPLNVRPWNNQMRHGVILADGMGIVSVSPQDAFLHRHTRLDTLGFDEPETNCKF